LQFAGRIRSIAGQKRPRISLGCGNVCRTGSGSWRSRFRGGLRSRYDQGCCRLSRRTVGDDLAIAQGIKTIGAISISTARSESVGHGSFGCSVAGRTMFSFTAAETSGFAAAVSSGGRRRELARPLARGNRRGPRKIATPRSRGENDHQIFFDMVLGNSLILRSARSSRKRNRRDVA
jgi:hypothetical protein